MTTFSFRGLVRGGRLGPQVLGHQGQRLVVDRSDVPSQLDESSGLHVCPLDQIFVRCESPILVFGAPNVSLVLPNANRTGWNRFAAFMFWRQASYVADTKGRVQAGVLFELVGLPRRAIDALNQAVTDLAGTRKASCAHSVALALHRAGFTSGGRSLRHVYRPSRLASILWSGGLEYQGNPVQTRVIQTRKAVSDHFVSVWKREWMSLVRLYHKYIRRSKHGSAPVFAPAGEAIEMSDAAWASDGPRTRLGVSIPSRLGVWLGFVFGEQPEFVVDLPRPIDDPLLSEPLRAFPGKLDLWTKFKKHVLFSRPVIRFMRRHLAARTEWIEDVPLSVLPAMLRPSPGPDRKGAFAYNVVITHHKVLLKRLQNRNGRDRQFVNWLLAKHVLMANYNPGVALPGEVWRHGEHDELVVHVNGSSGTYKPNAERVKAAAELMAAMFGVKVHMVDF